MLVEFLATTVADQSLSYNEACTIGSNQCKSSQGLSCPHGFCTCSSPYSWNTISTTCKTPTKDLLFVSSFDLVGTLLTYNQACSTSNQCSSSLGLICANRICDCDPYHSWNGTNNTCKSFDYFRNSLLIDL